MAETSPTPLRDEIIMDRLLSPLAFDELTHTVESMMLSKPLERTPVQPYNGERALMAALSAQGLRLALETKNGVESLEPGEPDDDDTTPYKIFQHPDEFIDKEMPGVAEWAQDFGDALLREAYKCLGTDAEQKLREYRDATTAEEQEAIIMWLDKRMYAMRERDSHLRVGPDDYLFYHPVRLSPRAVGQYPHHTLPPTCLGFSILATSFLYAAGAPTLHAGVMRTDGQDDLIESSQSFYRSAQDIAKVFGDDTDLTTTLKEIAYAGPLDLWDADSGYHAVALTRLLDGRWAQIDPNFRATQVVDDELYAQRITTVYEELEEFAPVAPLLELTARTPFMSDVKTWYDAYSGNLSISSESLDALREIFTDDDIESLPRRIYQVIFDMYRFSQQQDSESKFDPELLKKMEDEFLFADEHGDTDYLGDHTPFGSQLYALISRFVLYEQDVTAFKERCRRDERYRERRVSDVVAVTMAIHAVQTGLMVEGSHSNVPHAGYEVGRPATRVAMTVLSDFAALMAEDPLPPTFWHSNWPSLVPITEVAATAQNPAQKRVAAQMASFAMQKDLQYMKDYGNIVVANAPTTETE